MNIEICVYNLGTGATVYGSISNRQDWIELEEKVNPLGWNDIETQVMDSYTSYPITDNNLRQFVDLVEDFSNEDEDKIAALLNFEGYDTARSVLENELPFMYIDAMTPEGAFYEYYERVDGFMPPKEWENFIDWESVFESWCNDGLSRHYIGATGKMDCTTRWLFIQTH